jgi:amidase
MTSLHELTALEQAAAVKAREVSPVELVEHYLDRIDRHSDAVGAFVTVTAEAARAAARVAEQAVVAGVELPALAGVPIAIKDLNAVAGVPMTLGTAAFAPLRPDYDDHVVTRLRAAGTISLGKSATPEFGLPCYTEPDGMPPARTPWDLTRSAGGSSGGAGAAVAAGLVPFAQGSDGGGSVRIPASVCGLVGIKVSRGRISNGPLLGDVTGLGCNGPLARTVADAVAMLDAMAGPMPGDPHWAPPPAEPFAAAVGRDPGRLRIGRHRTPVIADTPVDGDCVTAWEETSSLLDSLGHDVEDIPSPFPPDLLPTFLVVWSASAAAVPVPADAELRLRPLTRWLREQGRSASAADFVAAMHQLQQAARRAVTATTGYDAVLTPTLAQPPARVGGLRDDADPATDFAAQGRFTPFTSAYNMTGQPAVSLPLSWTAAGLPIGVMLAGRPAGEATLISLAAQLEAASSWADWHPPIWFDR